MTPKTTTAPDNGTDSASELAFLTRALKAPTLREAVPRLAERARAESWTHEEFLAGGFGWSSQHRVIVIVGRW